MTSVSHLAFAVLGGCPRIETVARESAFESDFLVT